MRAIAVMIVFIAHCGLEDRIPGGLGVTIFFFLSGYLITSLLRCEQANTGRIDLPAFFVRRTLRIWPSLYVTMAFTIVVMMFVWPSMPLVPIEIAGQLAFISNYFRIGVPFLPLWSLAVEEHFYIVFPVLFAGFLTRLPLKKAAMFCAWACLVVLAIRIVSLSFVPDIGRMYFWSHTRVDSILFGCCLALWNNPALDKEAWRPKDVHVIAALGVMLFCLAFRDPIFRQTLRYSLQGVSLYVIFSYVLSNEGRTTRMLSWWPLRTIALYSFTFYLVQKLMIGLVRVAVPGISILGRILPGFVLSMLFCAVLYHFVERPMARRRRKMHVDMPPASPYPAA